MLEELLIILEASPLLESLLTSLCLACPPLPPPKFSIPSRKKVTPSFQILLSVVQLPSYCAIQHDTLPPWPVKPPF